MDAPLLELNERNSLINMGLRHSTLLFQVFPVDYFNLITCKEYREPTTAQEFELPLSTCESA